MTATIHRFPGPYIREVTSGEIALYGEPAPRSPLTLDALLFWASTLFAAFAAGAVIGMVGAVLWKAIH